MEFDPQQVLNLDPWLKPHIPAIAGRHRRLVDWKARIVEHEGGYDWSQEQAHCMFQLCHFSSAFLNSTMVGSEWQAQIQSRPELLVGSKCYSCCLRRPCY